MKYMHRRAWGQWRIESGRTPRISVHTWLSADEENEANRRTDCNTSCQRVDDLTPIEARAFAKALTDAANEVERAMKALDKS